MKIPRIDFDQPTCVILGAGASRGSSFVKDLPGTLPPLDTDFFTQAQRLSNHKPKELIESLIKDTVNIFGKDFNLTMEQYFTQIEHLSNIFEDYKLQGRPADNPFREVRSRFLQILAAVIDESLGREPKCKFHEYLVKSLSDKDSILSFNYDYLIDYHLKKFGQDKWNPKEGYGVQVYVQGKKGSGTEYWAYKRDEGEIEYSTKSLQLLKMHGSINWFPVSLEKTIPRLQLRKRWWHQQGNLQFEIAPPEWNKPIRSGVYQRIWRNARTVLKKVKAICFIGYSLPETDLPAQALLMVDAVQDEVKPLELLVIVNPDRNAQRRIRHVVMGRIDQKTRILTFDYFEQFAKFLHDEE